MDTERLEAEILTPDRLPADEWRRATEAPPPTRQHTEQALNARLADHFGQRDFAPATSAADYALLVDYMTAQGWGYTPTDRRVGSETAYACRVTSPAGGSTGAYHPTLAIAGCAAFLEAVEDAVREIS